MLSFLIQCQGSWWPGDASWNILVSAPDRLKVIRHWNQNEKWLQTGELLLTLPLTEQDMKQLECCWTYYNDLFFQPLANVYPCGTRTAFAYTTLSPSTAKICHSSVGLMNKFKKKMVCNQPCEFHDNLSGILSAIWLKKWLKIITYINKILVIITQMCYLYMTLWISIWKKMKIWFQHQDVNHHII